MIDGRNSKAGKSIIKSNDLSRLTPDAPEQILKRPYFDPRFSTDLTKRVEWFLKKHNLAIFDHTRVFDDGSCYMLSTDSRVTRYVVNNSIHVTAHVPQNLIKEKFWYLLTPSSPYAGFIHEVSKMSGAFTLIDYIRRYPGYYDMFSFWTLEKEDAAPNFVLNLREEVERFCLEFEEKNQDILGLAGGNVFRLPLEMKPNFQGLTVRENIPDRAVKTSVMDLQSQLFRFSQQVSDLNLSKREADCVQLLVFGSTVKEISLDLGISPRTVETHLTNIRGKLGCGRKSEIIPSLIKLNRG